MPAPKPVWAIDIGNNSLKALRLVQNGDKVEVIGLDYIEHPKVLSAEGITEEEKDQIIQATLNTFAARNELSKNPVAISVPGQTSFARFIKLPPVEPKRVPEIVKFEAIQQIPFDINEVEWDWQLMEKPDSPDTEVGIFAIKNELVGKYLEHFSTENLRISIVQMAPIALYNYVRFDRNELDDAEKKALVVLDMGADNTNLVVCTKASVWQRCIPLGGNNFTKAISDAFKLNFEKAEKLKRSAPMSKYARQIFHAMKPVFTDFGAEVQRSLGYYHNSHKSTAFTGIILLGGGFKMQGLNKYLQQTTQLLAARPDTFERLVPSANISSAKLHENISDFGIAYGLGIQMLGLGKVESNLLPAKIARSMMWAQKSKFFVAAAVILVIVSLLAFLKTNMGLKACSSRESEKYRLGTQTILQQSKTAVSNMDNEKVRGAGYEKIIQEYMDIFKNRNIVPLLHEVLLRTLPGAENNPAQAELYEAYAAGQIEKIKQIPRPERKQVFITSIGISYSDNLISAPLETTRFDSSSRTAGSSEYGRSSSASASSTETPAEQTENAGFIVIIEGYCPYEKIGEIMDPAGAGNNREKWGIITRLLNLDKIYDGEGNCPFELFQKDKIEHFKLETGFVDLANPQSMQAGIGILETKIRATEEELPAAEDTRRYASRRTSTESSDKITRESVLVDPLTKEEISRAYDLDDKGRKKYDAFGKPMYIERDRWFRIKAKILWKTGSQNSAGTGT